MFTETEVEAALTEYVNTSYSFWDEVGNISNGTHIKNLGIFNIVDVEGGEGQGSYYHIVFSITDDKGNTQLFKKEGYYSSYDGVDWYDNEELKEVKAVEKTIIVYE